MRMPFLCNNAIIIIALGDVAEARTIVISNVKPVVIIAIWNVQALADRNLNRIATQMNVTWKATVRIVSRIATLLQVNAV